MKKKIIEQNDYNIFLESPTKFITKLNVDFGDIVEVDLGIGKFVFLYNPNHIEKVLTNNNTGRTLFSKMFSPIAEKSLILNDGEKWKNERLMFQKIFNNINLDINKLEQIADDIFSNIEGNNINLQDLIIEFCMQFISCIMYGYRIDKEKINKIRKNWDIALYNMSQIMIETNNTNNEIHNSLNDAGNEIKKVILDIINEKKLKKDTINNISILDCMLNLGLSDEDIMFQLKGLYMAGFETISGALSWFVHNISLHKEWQNKIRNEILDKNFNVVSNKDVIKNVFNETIRLYPPLIILDRKLNEDIILSSEVLKKDTEIIISPYVVHRSEKYWDNPLQFNPNRFNTPSIKPYTFFPYGGGQMKCLGEKLSIIERNILIKSLLKKYDLTLDIKQEEDNKLVLRPQSLMIKVKSL